MRREQLHVHFGRLLQSLLGNVDTVLFLIILPIGAMGMLTLYSASDGGAMRFDAQMVSWGIALAMMFVIAQIKPDHLRLLAVPIFVVSIFLLLGVELFGETRKGATRWLHLGVISIQPSELMKFAMPMVLAWWFHQCRQFSKGFSFVVACIILAIPVALILHQPDLGTALLVLASGIAVIFFAGLSWKLILPPVVILGGVLLMILLNQNEWCNPPYEWPFLHSYQVKRVCTLLNPEADPLNSGFHILQSSIAIGSGGLGGKGFMQGTQTHLDFLPEKTTDFIFAVFAEEFGLIGNGVLLVLYLLLIWRGLLIAAKAETEFSRLLACGVTLIFFACVFVNLGMVSGILPVVGVPLPFMSYGGTALVSFAIGAGILMAISSESRQKVKKSKSQFL